MLSLLLYKNGKPVLKFPLTEGTVRIGRDDRSDIQLAAPEISREHCLIRRLNNHCEISDQSRNGTLLNGKKITTAPFTLNDTATIGDWHLRIEQSGAARKETVIRGGAEFSSDRLGSMLGGTQAMRELFELIRRVAPTDTAVCLVGESGTGKELAARAVHDLGSRHAEPFLPLNCGSIPENLIESILFGHEKGAFTGAAQQQKGLFEEADGGTLFLDEIGEMPMHLQTRLLRVLESKTIRRVGGKTEIPVDVRLVCATHRNLQEQIALGSFRQDLFFRLYIFPLSIPALRERAEDILPLAEHFLQSFSPDGKIKKLSKESQSKLQRHRWPGNVRELRNVIQRALILSNGETIATEHLLLTDFPDNDRNVGLSGTGSLADFERVGIVTVLKRHRGNQTSSALQLAISRSTLLQKIKKYEISEAEWS